jgi:NAD-dependent dihydropyrimidine dehydrogenase PreA subunit
LTSLAVKNAEKQYEQALQWKGRDNPDYGVIINRETCISKAGCRNCINFCPGDLIYFEDGKPVVKFNDECWFCGVCAAVCGPKAISYIFPKEILSGGSKSNTAPQRSD